MPEYPEGSSPDWGDHFVTSMQSSWNNCVKVQVHTGLCHMYFIMMFAAHDVRLAGQLLFCLHYPLNLMWQLHYCRLHFLSRAFSTDEIFLMSNCLTKWDLVQYLLGMDRNRYAGHDETVSKYAAAIPYSSIWYNVEVSLTTGIEMLFNHHWGKGVLWELYSQIYCTWIVAVQQYCHKKASLVSFQVLFFQFSRTSS